ncbi:MAG: hypothetical protein HC802_21795 [Caldilineaceae bacterium]|nr:hypothetical protein [Caldilineaceae bacterium]
MRVNVMNEGKPTASAGKYAQVQGKTRVNLRLKILTASDHPVIRDTRLIRGNTK